MVGSTTARRAIVLAPERSVSTLETFVRVE